MTTSSTPLAQDEADALGRALQKIARRVSGRDRDLETLVTELTPPQSTLLSALLNDAEGAFSAMCAQLLDSEGGVRWGFRGLNAMRALHNTHAMTLAHTLLRELSARVGPENVAKFDLKILVRLRAEEAESAPISALLEHAACALPLVEDGSLCTELAMTIAAVALAQNLTPADWLLRVAPLREKARPLVIRQHIQDIVENKKRHWSLRLAALWMLSGLGADSLEWVQQWLDRCYREFPAESFVGIEALRQVQANDATEAIEGVQMRKQASSLKNLSIEVDQTRGRNLIESLQRLVEHAESASLPTDPAELYVLLNGQPPSDRIVAAAMLNSRERRRLIRRFETVGQQPAVLSLILSRGRAINSHPLLSAFAQQLFNALAHDSATLDPVPSAESLIAWLDTLEGDDPQPWSATVRLLRRCPPPQSGWWPHIARGIPELMPGSVDLLEHPGVLIPFRELLAETEEGALDALGALFEDPDRSNHWLSACYLIVHAGDAGRARAGELLETLGSQPQGTDGSVREVARQLKAILSKPSKR